jgi:hypothetical protein
MAESWDPQDLLDPVHTRRRAADRANFSASGIGAAVELDATGDEDTGKRWVVMVSDGREFHRLDVVSPDLGPRESVPPTRVEDAVEQAAGSYPAEARLAELCVAAPLRFPAERLRLRPV